MILSRLASVLPFLLLPLLIAASASASSLRATTNNNHHHHRNLQATAAGRGIPGTTQTLDGYDTEMGKAAICWYSTGAAGPSPQSGGAISAEDAADTFVDTTADTTATDASDNIALPNPLVEDYVVNGRVHLLTSCPIGNSLQAYAPKVHTQEGDRLRTESWYDYTITATLNVTSLLREQQQILAAETAVAEKAAAAPPSVETVLASSEARQKAKEAKAQAALDAATARGFVADAVEDEEQQNDSEFPTSYVAFQVVNCVAGVSGFCSPFIHEEANHRLYVDAMARGEEAPASPDRGDLHGETHVHSPYIKVPLPASEGPVYEINVTVPMLINHPNSFFSIAAVQLFLTYPSSNNTNYSTNNSTKLVRYDMANALVGQDRLLTYQEPAVILTVPLGIQVVSYIAIGCTALVIAFLLQQVIQHRQHQILQLSQGSFLIVFLMAALVATCACVLLEPKNDAYCNWGRPVIMCFLQLMYAITVGRLWRIHTVISPLLLQTLQKRSQTRMHSNRKIGLSSSWSFLPPWLSKYTWICSFCCCCCCSSDGSSTAAAASTRSMNQMAISLMHFLERISTAVSSCCSCCGGSNSKSSGSPQDGQRGQQRRGSRGAKNLRRQVTPAQLAMVVFIFTFPQVLIQILAGTLQPLQYEIDFTEDESTGRAVCATDDSVTMASSLHMYGFYLFLLLIIVLLFMAQATRQLPSLFNETRYIFDSTLFTLVLMAVGISVILVTNHPTTSPGVQYLVTVSLVLCMTLNSTLRIVWPKLGMIWRGETVLVSKLVSDHAAKRRSGGGNHSSTLDSTKTSPSPQNNNDGSVYMDNMRISGLHPPPNISTTTSGGSGGSASGQLKHRGAAGAAANAGNLRYNSSFGHSKTILEELDQFHNESIVSANSAEVSETEDPAASSNPEKGKQPQDAPTTSDHPVLGVEHSHATEKKKEEEDDVLLFENVDDDAERKSLIDFDEEGVLDTEPDHDEQPADTPTASVSVDSTQKDTSTAKTPPASDSLGGYGDVEKNEASVTISSPRPPPPPRVQNHHRKGRPNNNRTAPVLVRQDETPARRLVLKMVDLEDCLSAVNERIMSGMAVPTEEWETLRRVTGKMGDIFTNDVHFEWEEKNGNRNDTRPNVNNHGGSRRSPKTSPPKAQPTSAAEELKRDEFEI